MRDLGLAGIGLAPQERHRLHDHARRAVAALQGVGLREGLLHRMEAAVLLQAFDGGDGLAADGTHARLARATGDAVQQDRAGAALPLAAAVLGPGEVQLVAQHAQQGPLGIGIHVTGDAVDDQLEERHVPSCPLYHPVRGGAGFAGGEPAHLTCPTRGT